MPLTDGIGVMDKNIAKKLAHLKRKKRVRKKVFGATGRPRLSVFRSLKHIYAQIIDDVEGKTLVAASSVSPEIRGVKVEGGKEGVAKKVGELIAEKAKAQGISTVSMDRSGFKYHGRMKALAEGARGKGLQF